MQITTLDFKFRLSPNDIRAFRAAIVELVGLGHHLFHGHDNSEAGVTKYSNAYPKIRFAVHKGCGRIMGMGEGGDAILRHLLPILPKSLVIAGRPCDTRDWRILNRDWEPQLLDEYQTFGLHQWMALNSDNYASWKEYDGKENARRLILDRCLTGHLRALAREVAPQIDGNQIIGRVVRQDRVKASNWHGNKFVFFNVVVEANFQPFYGLGLGRCHSFGFGEVCSERTYQMLTEVHRRVGNGEVAE